MTTRNWPFFYCNEILQKVKTDILILLVSSMWLMFMPINSVGFVVSFVGLKCSYTNYMVLFKYLINPFTVYV